MRIGVDMPVAIWSKWKVPNNEDPQTESLNANPSSQIKR